MLSDHNNAAILQLGYYQLIAERCVRGLCENGQSLSANKKAPAQSQGGAFAVEEGFEPPRGS